MMSQIKELYHTYIYGVMGTLLFHIILVMGLLIAELNQNISQPEQEEILVNFVSSDDLKELKNEQARSTDQSGKSNESGNQDYQESGSNRAVNDAAKRDKFFDASYKRDIEDAKNLVAEVNKQLSRKTEPIKKFQMPEETTSGQNPDSIKNTVYSGKSNIHYFLENRYHIKMPIPVYLAKSGGKIIVDIQVDQSGIVIKAQVRPAKNLGDAMLPEYAVQAAERTLFNADKKAPPVQKGTMTYNFVAQ
jgi:TonB family protein